MAGNIIAAVKAFNIGNVLSVKTWVKECLLSEPLVSVCIGCRLFSSVYVCLHQ